jgi:hypothetical protein
MPPSSLIQTMFILAGIVVLLLSPSAAFTTPATGSPKVVPTLRQGPHHRYPLQSSLSLRHPKQDSSFYITLSLSSSSSAFPSEDAEPSITDIETVTSDVSESVITPKKPSLWRKVISLYKRDTKDGATGDGLTFRQRLAKAGLSVVLSYGWVSNMSYCVSVSAAWYIFCQRTRLSPLAPGQWPKFLAVYSGFWVFNNVVRPIRFGVSVAISTQFDNVVQWIQTKANVGKGVAVGLTVFLANIVGTITLMCAGIALAASLAGVPVFPPK